MYRRDDTCIPVMIHVSVLGYMYRKIKSVRYTISGVSEAGGSRRTDQSAKNPLFILRYMYPSTDTCIRDFVRKDTCIVAQDTCILGKHTVYQTKSTHQITVVPVNSAPCVW